MNIVYASRAEDYRRPLAEPAPDLYAVRTMLRIIGHIMNNYELVQDA